MVDEGGDWEDFMAYWNGDKIVYFTAKPCEQYPGWEETDCGCCNGIQWGGEYPTECPDCDGSGRLFHHTKSGVLALYPGGPFVGKLPNKSIQQTGKGEE